MSGQALLEFSVVRTLVVYELNWLSSVVRLVVDHAAGVVCADGSAQVSE
jgi:hypothetical protein